jgi:Zn-dependent protease with chaperone function
MNFFAEQDRARKKSRWLVFWLAMTVLAIVTLVYLGMVMLVGNPVSQISVSGIERTAGKHVIAEDDGHRLAKGAPAGHMAASTTNWRFRHLWDTQLFLWTLFLVGGGILLVSRHKTRQLAQNGGVMLAIGLGGRMIMRDTADPAEKRLLNVIDEMSIAAGIPVPLVFTLKDEMGLNAFTAGFSNADTVIAVTQGMLFTMNRDELQGVIAHEISHIVNGDAYLNLKLIGLLHGILAMTQLGRVRMRSRTRGKHASLVIALGLFLWIIGSIGLLAAKIIKAAISREREYLADASAVQFTRNPDGIASALRALLTQGSVIQNVHAEEASHLFFGSTAKAWLFATHPPIKERIRRIAHIHLDDLPSQPSIGQTGFTPDTAWDYPVAFLQGAAPNAANLADAQTLIAALPASLMTHLRQAVSVAAVVYAFFLARDEAIRARQIRHLPDADQAITLATQAWLSTQKDGGRSRLPLLNLALPCLRELSKEAARQVLNNVTSLIRADGRVSVSKFALFSILSRTLAPRAHQTGELRVARLDEDIACLVSLIAHAGNADIAAAKAAYQAAMKNSPASQIHPLTVKKQLSLRRAANALRHLALATPIYRQRLLAACAIAVSHDGKVTALESELLQAFAESLDCPVPCATSNRHRVA